VSKFFETKSLRNLWGLAAKKTVVSKETLGWLEWSISLVIGFIVFEIVNKVLKQYLQNNYPRLKQSVLRFIVNRGWHVKLRHMGSVVRTKRVAFYAMVSIRPNSKQQ
jgi:hypothetical protein